MMNRKNFIKTTSAAILASSLPSGLLEFGQNDNAYFENLLDKQNPNDVISLPKGGGAIISEVDEYKLKPFTGTIDYSIPISISKARELSPDLRLTYNSINGNGLFGLGWQLATLEIKRKTSKEIPQYQGSDVFVLTGEDDLIAVDSRLVDLEGINFEILLFRPKVDSAYSRVEYWKVKGSQENADNFWRVITRENITHLFGFSVNTKLSNPSNNYAYSWKLEISYDAKGNYVYYQYKNDEGKNLHLKNIFYGNKKMFNRSSLQESFSSLKNLDVQNCCFQVSFDYGDYVDANEMKDWDIRPDSFSSYRSGFEICSRRLCKRVLLFHLFNDERLLVKSTDFTYVEDEITRISLLKSSQINCYKIVEGKYKMEAFPSLSFNYTPFEMASSKFVAIKGALPITAGSSKNYAWMDIHANGLPSLIENDPVNGTWSYWKNLGDFSFSNRQNFASMPAGVSLAEPTTGFIDFRGDGIADIMVKKSGNWRYYESDTKGGWKTPINFKQSPNEMLLRQAYFTDLTGNGTSDALVVNHGLVNYMICDSDGFSQPMSTTSTLPPVSFDQPDIKLADMTGDGLKDIIQIDRNNGQIKFWANLGYGRFADHQIIKASSAVPKFSDNELKNVFFVDITGSGQASLVFIDLFNRKVRCWVNCNGTSLSKEHSIDIPPAIISNSLQAQPLDVTGSGTIGIVFSTSVAGIAPHWYLCFNENIKGFILSEVNNNCGLVTKLNFESSTKDYLRNKPDEWNLPFPVQVLKKVEQIDTIQNTKYCQRLNYYQGYYDSEEREFVGFGLVEEWDTEQLAELTEDSSFENDDEELFVAPRRTKTWFDTGRYQKKFSNDYFNLDPENDKIAIPDSVGSNGSPGERRALRGKLIRKEVYGDDGSAKKDIPFQVDHHNYRLSSFSPMTSGGVKGYTVLPTETITYLYERDESDPRINHVINFESDKYGNILKSLSVAYPRRKDVYLEQKKAFVIFNENRHTAEIDDLHNYLTPKISESFVFQLDFSTDGNLIVKVENIGGILDSSKTLIDQKRVLYWDSSILQSLPLGQVAFHGLVFKSLTSAFDDNFLNEVWKGELPDYFFGGDGLLVKEGKYLFLDNKYWKVKERAEFDPTQFYVPIFNIDPDGVRTRIVYDKWGLLPIETVNALNLKVKATYDYVTLKPKEITDINNNKTEFIYNSLGLLSKIIHKGKGNEESDSENSPSVIYQYEFSNIPIKISRREKVLQGEKSNEYRQLVTYIDGLGREIITKQRCEYKGATKWISSGKKNYNNKGQTTKVFEPFYSDDPSYNTETEKDLAVTMFYYDVLDREIKKVYPDGSMDRTLFSVWEQMIFDRNDNDKKSPHFNTPKISVFDSLGRIFLKNENLNNQESIEEHTIFNAKSKPLEIYDAHRRRTLKYVYDWSGEILYTDHIDKGEEWFIRCAGNPPLFKRNSLGVTKQFYYDGLDRLVKVIETNKNITYLSNYIIYGEVFPNAFVKNFNGQKIVELDQTGILRYLAYDGKGNVLGVARKFVKDQFTVIDWSAESTLKYSDIVTSEKLTGKEYTTENKYNSLGQLVVTKTPNSYAVKYEFDPCGRIKVVNIVNAGKSINYLKSVEYNALGQVEILRFQNGLSTKYEYDAKTARLRSLGTMNAQGLKIQNVLYEYDRIGNIVTITDQSQKIVFFNNNKVDAVQKFEYDSLYRLIKCEGREKSGSEGNFYWKDIPCQANNDNALNRFTRGYEYDKIGNLMSISHVSGSGKTLRKYNYVPGRNILVDIKNGKDEVLEEFTYDGCGNTIRMSHIKSLDWNSDHRLLKVDMGGGGTQHNYYDGNGTRTRKVISRTGGFKEEYLYFGNYETHISYRANTTEISHSIVLEFNNKKFLIIDIKNNVEIPRYQLGNQLGSIMYEVDENGNRLSYEEFYPFGKTSLRFCKSSNSQKKYRYIGKELDSETGLYYIGSRYYYAPIARWLSVDPLFFKSTAWSSYCYSFNNPIKFHDPDGEEPSEPEENDLMRTAQQVLKSTAPVEGSALKGVAIGTSQRYRLYPKGKETSHTKFGIRDMEMGRVSKKTGQRVGDWVFRMDFEKGVERPYHINVNPKITGVKSPHIQIPGGKWTLAGFELMGDTLHLASKVAAPIALGLDTYQLYNAYKSDHDQIGENTIKTAGNVYGQWAGTSAGATLGAVYGAEIGASLGAWTLNPFTFVIATAAGGFVGGLVGGIAGAFGGSIAGENLGTVINEARTYFQK